MTKYVINTELQEEERKVQIEINNLLNKGNSFYFSSGAGSGKTYALIESIKYFLSFKYNELISSGQKVACITYTNSAKDEINERILSDNNVLVCTIHSFLWDVINSHQVELLAIHKDYLNKIIKENDYNVFLCDKRNDDKAYKSIRSLSDDEVLKINEISFENKIDIFNMRNKNAKDYWADINRIYGPELGGKLKSNKQGVDKILRALIKINNLKKCVSKIDNKEAGYLTIDYNEVGGREILHRNKIGHDTLINYAYWMVSKYDILKKIVIDSYPIVFIDEYQDTHEKVIKIFDCLLSFSNDNNFRLCMYGDPVQSIYSNNINEYVLKNRFEYVYKNINRRSHHQIIDSINFIRGSHQPIKQDPIYLNNDKGSSQLYLISSTSVQESVVNEKLNKYRKEWGISRDNKITCLVLKNKMLSSLCGFEDFYQKVDSIYSKDIPLGFEKINEELISKDLRKLGPLALFLYGSAKTPFFVFHREEQPLNSIFSDEILNESRLECVFTCIDEIRGMHILSLYDYFERIFDLISRCKSEDLKKLYKSLIPYNVNSIEELTLELTLNIIKDSSEQSVLKIISLLKVEFCEYINWLKYILSLNGDDDIEYYTCHGSKGLEFNNVFVLLDDNFNKCKDKFTSFFHEDINTVLDLRHESTRNLLYVSCSRSIKNLRVILFTENCSVTNSMEDIFDKVN